MITGVRWFGLLAFVLVVARYSAVAGCSDTDALTATRSAAEVACPCASAANHGQYVKCVKSAARAAVENGNLPKSCKGAVVGCAANSTCGKQGFVTCCRRNRLGKGRCSIKPASRCKAPKQGTVAMGAGSCCDACGGSGGCPSCGNGIVESGEQCDGANLNSNSCVSQGFQAGTLRCNSSCTGFDTSSCNHCDNATGTFCDRGDGTIVDSTTNLQWEKKTTTGGGNPADLHDVNNTYAWAGVCSINVDKFCQPTAAAEMLCRAQTPPGYWATGCEQCTAGDGTCESAPPAVTTVWDWLDQINVAGFAGHNDWRLPTNTELESLLVPPCDLNPCIPPIFGPTASDGYWSSSSSTDLPGNAVAVDFYTGVGSVIAKFYGDYTRTVRGGL